MTSNKPRKYYINIFISITLTIAITIFTLSTILYYRFENIATSLIYNSTKENLVQVSHSIEYMKETAKSIVLQIYYDSDISNLMYMPAPSEQDISTALKRLDYFRFSNPSFTGSIYVYSRQSAKVYVSASSNSTPIADVGSFFDTDFFKIANNIKNYNNLEFLPRKIPFPTAKKDTLQMIDGYSFIFYDSVTAGALNSAVILNVPEEWLHNTLISLNNNPKLNNLVINKNGITLTNSGSTPMLTDISGENYIKRILDSSKQADYFVADVAGVKSLVSFVNTKETGWKFIMTIPYEIIVGKIIEMRNYTILIGLVILFLGLLTSLIISKRIYKPIGVTLGKIDTLIKEKRDYASKQQQEYLRSLLQGNTEMDRGKIKIRLNALEIKLSYDEETFLLLLKIDNYESFCSSYVYADRKIFKYAISNIACELYSKYGPCEAVDAGDDHVAIIICDAGNKEYLRNAIESIQDMVKIHLKLSLSVTISTAANSLEDLCNVYSDALEYSNYRLFKSHSCIIDVAETAETEKKEYIYPIQKEEQLIQNLQLGKISIAKEAYTSIMQNALETSYPAFNSAMLRLFSRINDILLNLSKDHPMINYNSSHFFNNLSKCELKDDIDHLFLGLFEHVVLCMDGKKSLRTSEVIDTIMEMVKKNYSKPELCLNMIADHISMNPVYLGRLFKKITQISVGEYINNCRMEIAKDMLTNNNMTVGEIAEQIGILNKPHFHTLFKKQFGKTPTDFRHSIKNQGELFEIEEGKH